MTLELVDTRFGRIGYPKTVEHTESDLPDRWDNAWKRRDAYNTDFYIEQDEMDMLQDQIMNRLSA